MLTMCSHKFLLPQLESVFVPESTMRIRLVRKFANAINGIDLASISVGDVVELKFPEAVLLIREGWAEPLEEASTNVSDQLKKS
jgi:hypothetical protein